MQSRKKSTMTKKMNQWPLCFPSEAYTTSTPVTICLLQRLHKHIFFHLNVQNYDILLMTDNVLRMYFPVSRVIYSD